MATDREWKAAGRAMSDMRKHVPHAVAATYSSKVRRLLVTLSDGLEIALDPARLQTLENARPADLKRIEINAGGYELFFPALDDGIWIPGLLAGLMGSRKWMEQQVRRDRAAARRRKPSASPQPQSSRTAA